jgi:hypothetical protein
MLQLVVGLSHTDSSITHTAMPALLQQCNKLYRQENYASASAIDSPRQQVQLIAYCFALQNKAMRNFKVLL